MRSAVEAATGIKLRVDDTGAVDHDTDVSSAVVEWTMEELFCSVGEEFDGSDDGEEGEGGEDADDSEEEDGYGEGDPCPARDAGEAGGPGLEVGRMEGKVHFYTHVVYAGFATPQAVF